MGELIYEEESYVVKGAVFEVYKTMGAGFLESSELMWRAVRRRLCRERTCCLRETGRP